MADAMKHMASNFVKQEKFKMVDFKIWKKKMHFLLSSMSMVCLILNDMFDSLFDVYLNVETSKELLDTLETKYMAEDSLSKKFLVSDFTNYKMTDSKLFFKQYNKLLGILKRYRQHKMNMDESIQVSCIIDKLSPSWKDFKHTLKHLKEELTLIEVGSHLRIEESFRVQDSDKPKATMLLVLQLSIWWSIITPPGGNVGNKANGSCTKGSGDGSSNPLKGQNMFNKSLQIYYVTYVSEVYFVQDDDVTWLNIVFDNIGSAFISTSKLNDSILWHAILGHVHFKRMQDMSKDGLIPAFDMDTEKCKTCMLTKITKKPFKNIKHETEVLELIHSDLCDLHANPSLENKKYFVTFINDSSRFCYVYLLHSKDEALDKFKVFKTEVELQQEYLIKRFRTDRGRTVDIHPPPFPVGAINHVVYAKKNYTGLYNFHSDIACGDYKKLLVTDDMVEYVLKKYGKNWTFEDEIAIVILKDLWMKYGKDDKGKEKEATHDQLKVNKVMLFVVLTQAFHLQNDKGKAKVHDLQNRVEKLEVDLSKAIKAKQTEHDLDDVDDHDIDDHDIDDVDLENRIKKREEDFGRMLKAKKERRQKGKGGIIEGCLRRDPQHPKLSQNNLLPLPQDPELLPQDQELPLLPLLQDPELPLLPTRSRAPATSTSTFKTTTRSRAPTASTSNAQAAFTLAPRRYMKIAMTECVLSLRAPDDLNAPLPLAPRKRKSKK
nr:zinc finger, CCHC-type [Tanacetum cinerariifolium]